MNKLAVLAFALLMFFSTMLWYLANGSLNDYLKSQVVLQSQYYTGQQTQLLNANFYPETGIANFTELTVANLPHYSSPLLFSVANISTTLAQGSVQQLNSPSIQNRTTSLVHVAELKFANLQVWSEKLPSESEHNDEKAQRNIDIALANVTTKLATDYPALYPEISAKIYAQKHPELSESLVKSQLAAQAGKSLTEFTSDTALNQAVIESKAAKQEKRLLGKAQVRVKVSHLIIEQLTLHLVENNKQVTKTFHNVSLGSFGEHEKQGVQEDKGLASNQLGGEILRRLLTHIASLPTKNSPIQSGGVIPSL